MDNIDKDEDRKGHKKDRHRLRKYDAVAVLAMISLLTSLLLFSGNISSEVTGNTPLATSNLIGGMLFVLFLFGVMLRAKVRVRSLHSDD